MNYQSKTYSLSDKVVERIEAEREKGISPDRFLWSLMFKTKKPSRRQKAIEAIKASDPVSAERSDVEYGSEELPSGGSINRSLDAVAPLVGSRTGKASVEHIQPTNWRAGRKPIPKPSQKEK